MPLACIYHKTQGMKVVSFADREKMVASGEWFKHPDDAKPKKVKKPTQVRVPHEKPNENVNDA